MSSGIFVTGFYGSLLYAAINVGSDQFGIMLVSEDYRPDFTGHTRRSDVEMFEIVGQGYNGPVKTTAKVNYDADCLGLEFGGVRWPEASLRTRGAVYFRAGGGDPSEDELIAFNDFGRVMECTRGTFSVAPLTLELK